MMLDALRGRDHRVLTGVAIARGPEIIWQAVTTTLVWMRAYTDDEIAWYVATGRPLDKAGGYAIQDPEFRPVARIEGCYPNVVGLPLCEVKRALTLAGLPTSEGLPLAPHPARGPSAAPDPRVVRERGPGGTQSGFEKALEGRTASCDLCARARDAEPPA
jgi:hypothetical protein